MTPMEVVTPEMLDRYVDHDPVARVLDEHSVADDADLVAQRWLRTDAAKRAVTWQVYRELLRTEGLSVLDVGAGLSGLQRALGERHDYTIVDLLVHDPTEATDRFRSTAPDVDLIQSDWSVLDIDRRFDVIVSNDLFPNVDQRLITFLEWSSRLSDRMIMSLTYFHSPKAYAARRIDGDEILHVASWSAAQIEACDGIGGWQGLAARSGTDRYPPSLFGNGRNVAIADLRGVDG